MSFDSSSTEDDLRQLRAAELDEALLARLEACAEGTWTRLDPVELEFEQRLRGIAPARISSSLMASLEAAVSDVPFAKEAAKIVRFPEREAKVSRQSRAWWSAAAAVALFGGLAGSLVPFGKTDKSFANAHSSAPSIRSAPSSQLIPAGFNRGLKEASDEGVIWQSSQQPHRVLKVVYQDRVTLKDASGKTYQVEQPRVEYILVPAKTN
jgi:hypothetical protein